MTQNWWKWLFTWEGKVGRLQYLLAGTILSAVKLAIDWSVANRFGETWRIWNYLVPRQELLFLGMRSDQPALYGILWLIAIPFFWVGIALTLRRLQDVGKSAGWVFLFFAPFANLALFLSLSLLPSVPSIQGAEAAGADARNRVWTRTTALGVFVSTVLGLLLVTLGARFLMEYGWGLFLGLPFLTGFVAAWFLNKQGTHTKLETAVVSSLTILLIGLVLIGFRYEGLVCLLMALPLALPFAIAGGLLARYILGERTRTAAPPTFVACVALVPFMMLAQHLANPEPPVNAVTTSITIDAPVSVVWKNVIAFPPLHPPDEWIFRAGIAYPTAAQIVGSGPGAVRYCRFSTGDFVEPITVWDEDRLLAFDVTAQPPALRELSPWKITPPHVERNYMRSKHGQFRFVALSDHRTLLEGTTWYQDYFWPQAYWRAWSDVIVHRIHMRVLEHVKEQAEAH